MMPSNFSYREFRTRTVMTSQIPIFSNAETTRTPKYLHHVSLYGVTNEEATLQMRLGNTKNRPVQHYSSELILDTDNEQTAENVWNELCQLNLRFELWKLNNYKFLLQRSEEDVPSLDMCYQDRQWVRDTFSHCNHDHGLDLSIYSSPFHLIRARNAIHEVTRAKSVLVDVFAGHNLVSTKEVVVKKLERKITNIDVNISDWRQFQLIIDIANVNFVNKHMAIWQVSRDLSRFCSISTALEVVLIYARSINYEDEKAERAFYQGFERREAC